MAPPDRTVQDLVQTQVLKTLVTLVSRHDPKLLIRLESDVGRFVSTLPIDQQASAFACFSSFMGSVVSADFRNRPDALLEGAPDWIRQWLDAPLNGKGSGAINFEIIPRNGKWRITQEGKLFGEFADRVDAVTAVKSAIDFIHLAGGDADWFDAVH